MSNFEYDKWECSVLNAMILYITVLWRSVKCFVGGDTGFHFLSLSDIVGNYLQISVQWPNESSGSELSWRV
jgi:hypothetical protein